MSAKLWMTGIFLITSTYGGAWAVKHPEKWMDEGQIKAYRDFVEAKNLTSITIGDRVYDIKSGDVDLLKLYDLAKIEAERIIASGDTSAYQAQLAEYNAFFRMMGADEIPLPSAK